MNSTKETIKYKGKNYRVQVSKGWKHIVTKQNGERSLISVKSIIEMQENPLLTVDDWERHYQKNVA